MDSLKSGMAVAKSTDGFIGQIADPDETYAAKFGKTRQFEDGHVREVGAICPNSFGIVCQSRQIRTLTCEINVPYSGTAAS
jgi:hypothetical protein